MWIAPGAAWTIPFAASPGYHGTRQDLALSLSAQFESQRWLFQVEAGFGGFSASNPLFRLFAARAGLFVARGNPAVAATLGLGYLTYQADSSEECPEFGCDKLQGSGAAIVGEAFARFDLGWSMRPALFISVVVPAFNVSQHVSLVTDVRAAPVVTLGVRAFVPLW
jgi:hypothetical protein